MKFFTGDRATALVAGFNEGRSVKRLAEQFGTCRQTVRAALKENGISLQRGGRFKPYTEEETARAAKLYREGMSQEEISKTMKTHQSRVSRMLRFSGEYLSRRMNGGMKHPRWKGGRVMMQGYHFVLIDPSHKFASMRQAQGYVAEHRLVMAESLGRPLTAEETTHHLDGDKTNNSIENLQLHTKNHGLGVTMRCRRCGCIDIEHLPLGK